MSNERTQSRFPDITPGVPIPDFVPPTESEHEKVIKAMVRAWRWSFAAIVLLYIAMLALKPGEAGIYVAMGIALLIWIVPLLIIRPKKVLKKQRADPWSIPLGMQIRYQAGVVLMVLSVSMIAYTQQGVIDLLFAMSLYIAFAGAGLIGMGRFARQPGPISCISCSYPLVGLMIPCQCPECGRYILGPGHTTDRPRVKSPWFLWGGLTMIVFGLTMTTLRFTNPGCIYAPLPNSMLLGIAADNRDAFSQLDLTNLSDEETQQLVSRILDKHAQDNWYGVSSAQRQWLAAKAFSGGLSLAQINQIMEPQKHGIRIVAPAQVRLGQEVTLDLEADFVASLGRSFWPDYYFGGYLVGQDPTPHAQTITPQSRLSLVKDIPLRVAAANSPVYRFVPQQTGTITIHARVVLALFPGGTTANVVPVPIDWDQPPGAMFPATPIWSTTIELAHTIEVVPE